MTKQAFSPNYWGTLRQFELPHSIVQNEMLLLKPAALAVLLVLFESGKAQSRTRLADEPVQVRMTQDLLMKRSGYTKNVITGAVKELEQKGFVRRSPSRRKQGEYGSNEYTLMIPATDVPLKSKGTNILYSNDVQYIKLPVCVVKEHEAEWSIARMSSSEKRMYVVICWLANRANKNKFDCTFQVLKKLCRFSTADIAQAALEGLANKSLISVQGEAITLHDPYTGEPLHVEDGDPASDPANYYVKAEKGRAKRWDLNTGNAEHVVRLLQACGLEVTSKNSGELAIRCPFHADSDPSCFVNPMKRVFYCFGCKAAGTLTKLVMHMRGVEKGTALRLMADSAGVTLEFHEPDKNAEAIYSYHDLEGNVVKQVLRYPGKKFIQRRPARSGGWIWDVEGIPPFLYNLNRVQYVNVICICEGEKDCDTIINLGLYDARRGEVVATTSGTAGSWQDEFADHLKRKRVVLMPDADEAGEQYRAEVEASLRSREIEYRVVRFDNAKDVSEFVAKGGTKELIVNLIGRDWVRATEPSILDLDDDVDAPKVTI